MQTSEQLPAGTDLPETLKRPAVNARAWTVYGAYMLLAIALLLAAFSRSLVGLKPGELALVLFVGALAARRVVNRDWSFPTTPIDAGFILIILAGTLLPLVTMEVRGIYVTRDDLRALLGPVEYYLWYRAFLDALPLPRELPGLARVMLILITIVSAIGDLQIFHAPGVQSLLVKYFPTYETLQSVGFHRATSLVGGWEVLAALAAYALVLINQFQTDPQASQALGEGWNRWLLVMLGINVVALVATLSAAGFLALALGYALAWVFNRKLARATLVALGLGVVAAIALAPFIGQRLRLQFGGGTSHSFIPQTWLERYQHWQIVTSVVFVNWPTVLFGVQPSFTYPVSAFGSTESLYLLFLYRGGLIYVLAFLVFAALVLRTVWQARAQAATHGTTGNFSYTMLTAMLIILIVTFALGIVDAHFVDAGESQFLLTITAAGAGMVLRTERAPRRALFAELAPNARLIARGALALGLVAALGTGALAYRQNKHLMPPPTPLTIPGAFDPTAPTWLENQQLGSAQWQSNAALSSYLQGYAGAYAVDPGSALPLYISAAGPTSVEIQVYRMGWYFGQGGKLYASGHLASAPQLGTWDVFTHKLRGCDRCQVDPLTHAVDANWQASYTVHIGTAWPGGVYLIKLAGTNYTALGFGGPPPVVSYIPFVVRAPASKSQILAVLPFMTWAANDLWGGANLATNDVADRFQEVVRPGRATQVSFDRPFVDSAGAGELLNFDLHAVRWLERSGFDVTYTTDLDLAEHPEQMADHRIVIMTGSSAYWPLTLRDGFEQALQGGVNLAFLGAQNGYWQARLAPDTAGNPDRVLVCYKVQSAPAGDPTVAPQRDPLFATRPQLVTARWRDPLLNRPENALLGTMYGGTLSPGMPQSNSVFTGAVHPDWVANANGPLDFIATTSNDLKVGQHITGALLGYGYDSIFANGKTPGDLIILGSSPIASPATGAQPVATTAYYRYAGSGPIVFTSGSDSWSWSLDEFTFAGADLPNTLLGRQTIENMMSNVLFTMLPPRPAGS